jgi:hypothetical protein
MAYLPVALQLIVAAAVLVLSAKYLFGPVPADYHRRIISGNEGDGVISDGVQKVLTALYRAMGGAFCATGVAVGLIGWFAQGTDLSLFGIPAIALVAALPTIFVAHRTEKATGVRTPWRPPLAVAGLAVVASLIAVATG